MKNLFYLLEHNLNPINNKFNSQFHAGVLKVKIASLLFNVPHPDTCCVHLFVHPSLLNLARQRLRQVACNPVNELPIFLKQLVLLHFCRGKLVKPVGKLFELPLRNLFVLKVIDESVKLLHQVDIFYHI